MPIYLVSNSIILRWLVQEPPQNNAIAYEINSDAMNAAFEPFKLPSLAWLGLANRH
jgi:hypothetical protein